MTHQSKKALGLQKKQSVFSNGLAYRQFESSGNSLYILPTKEYFPFISFFPFFPYFESLLYERELYEDFTKCGKRGKRKRRGKTH
jgi:hypothetical protein